MELAGIGRRPAVAPCLAVVAGIAWAGVVEPALPALSLLTLGLHGPHGRRWLPCLVALAVAAWIAGDERRRHDAAVTLPESGRILELALVGRVLDAPEVDRDGRRRLLVRPEAVEGLAPPGRRIALWIEPGDRSALGELDRLAAGDRVRTWARARRPPPGHEPWAGDPATRLRASGLDGTGSVKSPLLIERLEVGRWGPSRLAARAKQLARSRLDRALGSRGRPREIAGAMLLGDRLAVAPETWQSMRRAGLAHLVAISGLHVGILLVALEALLTRLGVDRRGRLALAVPIVALFALAVGARSSVCRAALGAIALAIGRASGREGDPLNSLSLIAALLLVILPASLDDAAFQLTFVATAGIVALGPRLAPAIRLPRPLASGVAVCLAAYLATAPVVAWHFGRLAPVGLVTNLAAAPACALVLATGFATLVLEPLPIAGSLSAWAAQRALQTLAGLATLGASIPNGAILVPRPTPATVAIYYTVLVLPLVGRRRDCRVAPPWRWALVALAATWIHVGPPPLGTSGRVEAALLDVGQGQALLLRGPAGGLVLIDTGGSASGRFDPGERVVIPYLSNVLRARRIEVLILSHDHVDHAGGALAILRDVEVGELWLGPGSHRSERARQAADLARRRGVALVLAERGLSDVRAGLPLAVLAPGRDDGALTENDRSVVVLAGRAPSRILVPGDLERAGERELGRRRQEVAAEALVVPHHGSRYGSSSEFLRAVGPSWALVSAGRFNAFGHPHAETRRRLRTIGATLLRTDHAGTIWLESGPSGWSRRVSPR